MPLSPMLYKAFTESLKGNFGAILIFVIIAIAIIVWWLRGLHEDRKNFKNFIGKFEGNISDIQNKINKIFIKLGGEPVAEAKSPLRLTDFGEKIATEIEVHSWADSFKEELLERIEKPDPYEVQMTCFEYAQNSVMDDLKTLAEGNVWEEPIKTAALRHGIDLDQVLEVVGIVLRDMMLKELNIKLPD